MPSVVILYVLVEANVDSSESKKRGRVEIGCDTEECLNRDIEKKAAVWYSMVDDVIRVVFGCSLEIRLFVG